MDFFAAARSIVRSSTAMVKKGGLEGGAAADGSGEAVVVTAEMMAPAESSHSDRLQPRRTEVGPRGRVWVDAIVSLPFASACHVLGGEICTTQRAAKGLTICSRRTHRIVRVHHT